jgi:hypothetical protein
MAISFFSNFPTITYDLFDKGSTVTLTDIVRNVDVNDLVAADNASVYTYYDINNGERPDAVSQSLYGTPEYYWTFFIVNNEMRGGINNSWPLSSQNFEKMIEREYDNYSILTVKPIVNYTDISASRGSLSCIPLTDTYLPYLRLSPLFFPEITAKIKSYNPNMLQLAIYDIVGSSRSFFIQNERFKISWVNPFTVGSYEWIDNENLKNVFTDEIFAVYMNEDTLYNNGADFAAIIESCTIDGVFDEAAFIEFKHTYVFINKTYDTNIDNHYKWELYHNAAIQYYKTDPISKNLLPISAYDVMTDPNIVNASFISYYEKENLDNEKKSKIKVIRPDKVKDFVNTYYNTLNKSV